MFMRCCILSFSWRLSPSSLIVVKLQFVVVVVEGFTMSCAQLVFSMSHPRCKYCVVPRCNKFHICAWLFTVHSMSGVYCCIGAVAVLFPKTMRMWMWWNEKISNEVQSVFFFYLFHLLCIHNGTIRLLVAHRMVCKAGRVIPFLLDFLGYAVKYFGLY